MNSSKRRRVNTSMSGDLKPAPAGRQLLQRLLPQLLLQLQQRLPASQRSNRQVSAACGRQADQAGASMLQHVALHHRRLLLLVLVLMCDPSSAVCCELAADSCRYGGCAGCCAGGSNRRVAVLLPFDERQPLEPLQDALRLLVPLVLLLPHCLAAGCSSLQRARHAGALLQLLQLRLQLPEVARRRGVLQRLLHLLHRPTGGRRAAAGQAPGMMQRCTLGRPGQPR